MQNATLMLTLRQIQHDVDDFPLWNVEETMPKVCSAIPQNVTWSLTLLQTVERSGMQEFLENRIPTELKLEIWDFNFEGNNRIAICIVEYENSSMKVAPIELMRVTVDQTTGQLRRDKLDNGRGVWLTWDLFASSPHILQKEYLDYVVGRHWFYFMYPRHLQDFARELRRLEIRVPAKISVRVHGLADGDEWVAAIRQLPTRSTIHFCFIAEPYDPETCDYVLFIKAAGHTLIIDWDVTFQPPIIPGFPGLGDADYEPKKRQILAVAEGSSNIL